MSEPRPVHPASTRLPRVRPTRLAAAVLATAALLAAGAAPATAASASLPSTGGSAAVVTSVHVATPSSLRAALEALPDHRLIRIDQVVKEFAQGVLD